MTDKPKITDELREHFGRQTLRECFRVLENIDSELAAWKTMAPSSRMAEDNAASSLHRQMSYELHYLLSSALDHLNLVHKLWDDGEMPPFAPFTLIRSAVESSAYGIWMQSPGSLDERLIRLLQLQWDQRQNVDSYTVNTGAHSPAITAWLEAVLNDTKDRRPVLRARSVKKLPTITKIISETDTIVGRKAGLDGMAAWRIGSGITHGNQNFALGLMDRKRITLDDGSDGSEHSISVSRLSMVYEPAVDYAAYLMRLILDTSESRPGHTASHPITGGPPHPKVPGFNM